MKILFMLIVVILGISTADAQSRGAAPSAVPPQDTSDSRLYSYIRENAGKCISNQGFIQKDYLSRRRQGLFQKSNQYDRQTHGLYQQKNALMKKRGTQNSPSDAQLQAIDKKIETSNRQARLWDDHTINGYHLYFKNRWENQTGNRMGDTVPGFKIRGGQPLLNYDVMMVDALARTLVNEAGLCEQAAESHVLFGTDFCQQRCGKTQPCLQKCIQYETNLGQSQKGLHYAMVISSIFDRKILIESSQSEAIRESFGRSHLPEMQTAYWEQAFSRTMQYSLWNTPDYPNTQRVNPTLFSATCPIIEKNRGLSRYTNDEWTEYQWNLALRTAFDHYKLSTHEALSLRDCRAKLGLQNSASCLSDLKKSGHDFAGRGPFQPWLNPRGIPSGPFLFYTHSVAFGAPMRESPQVYLGIQPIKPLRLLYKTTTARGTEIIREGSMCRPRLWKNPMLESHLKSHPL